MGVADDNDVEDGDVFDVAGRVGVALWTEEGER